MKRRFGMWIGILIILIVGVSVTKMTKDFVVSQGVAASSILKAADAADVAAVPETYMEIHMETSEVTAGGTADGAFDMEAESPMEAAAAPRYEVMFEETIAIAADDAAVEAVEEAVEIAEVSVENPVPVAGMTGGPGAAVHGVNAAAMEGTTGPGMNETVLEPESPRKPMEPGVRTEAAPLEAGPGMVSEKAAYSIKANGNMGTAKEEDILVKSPLDPVISTDEAIIEREEEEPVFTAEDFFARFVTAEESIVKIWEKATTDNPVAYNAAAEQERVLWDYELNLLYGEIRSRMSNDEAEKLKHLELEWLKTRDQYAEKAAAKSSLKNVQKQDPVYIRALAEKTKERCYWLVAEYEEFLDQKKSDDIKKK